MQKPLSENDIVDYVCKNAKYLGGTEPYYISWKCGAFQADDTRKLVLKICKEEGIMVK